MKSCFRDNRGFTIMEVLAALILLSIVAVPLAKTFMDGFKFQARSQVKTESNKVIEYVAEQLKNGGYSSLGEGVETSIKSFVNPGTGNLEIDVSSIPDRYGKLTAGYTVSIEKVNETKEVQKGGIGTPSTYDLEMRVSGETTSFVGNGDFLNALYSDKLLDIQSSAAGPNNGEFYTVLVESDNAITIDVRKQIIDKVKFYLKGDVELRVATDPDLTREQKVFERIKLGEKEDLMDEKEYLCEVRLTATNKNDGSITSSMNVTFSIFIKNEGGY